MVSSDLWTLLRAFSWPSCGMTHRNPRKPTLTQVGTDLYKKDSHTNNLSTCSVSVMHLQADVSWTIVSNKRWRRSWKIKPARNRRLLNKVICNNYLEEINNATGSALVLQPAKRTPPNISRSKNSNTQRTENKTTDVVTHQHSRRLLKMDILMSETCWAHNKWNN